MHAIGLGAAAPCRRWPSIIKHQTKHTLITHPSPSSHCLQDVFRLFGNASQAGVVLLSGGMRPAQYEAAMRGALYCLAPYGFGWGIRLSEAVALGCVPIIVQVSAGTLTLAHPAQAAASEKRDAQCSSLHCRPVFAFAAVDPGCTGSA